MRGGTLAVGPWGVLAPLRIVSSSKRSLSLLRVVGGRSVPKRRKTASRLGFFSLFSFSVMLRFSAVMI